MSGELSRRVSGVVVTLLVLLLCAPVPGRAKEAGSSPPAVKMAVEPLEIVTTTGPHLLRVEVARTPDQRERGLMYRTALPADGGMLFDFHEERPVSMWMKNTPLSLDMIFVSRAGRIVSVALGAEPYSERVISSGGAALAVIELAAGAAQRLSISVGDVVKHPIFDR
ncbi:DUF192 domain-containing protein [Methylosinus sp. H3A]|uniref:DUF192 domain-containing protein n=1 Tax=Methylosinus sp. H3A TaxID=2785786 RepID=UPI0018C294C8|nr:DUF192 domain-containing protein [Methylosinus sp. H3A]MBG0811566.1 DUF192 domain-containing protein [Methylosinus sp. H3A]